MNKNNKTLTNFNIDKKFNKTLIESQFNNQFIIENRTAELIALAESLNNENILVGLILGDGNINLNSSKTMGTFKYDLSFDKKDILLYVYNMLSLSGPLKIDLNPIRYTERLDLRHNSINSSLYFTSKANNNLINTAKLFLNNLGKKILPSNIFDLLTPVGLAF
jgi:LAGLIDADG DNA endonuclease family